MSLFTWNVLSLTIATAAVASWLYRYTGLLEQVETWYTASSLAVLIAVAGGIPRFFKKDWFKTVQELATRILKSIGFLLLVTPLFWLAVLLSLNFGRLACESPSGSGATLRVRAFRSGSATPEPEYWDTKKLFRSGGWFTTPFWSIPLRVSVQGMPTKSLNLTPWFWPAGDSCRLEYPAGFLRPVVLVVPEQQLTLYSEQDPKGYELIVSIAGNALAPIPFDGHSIWIGCSNLDELDVPADAAKLDWPSTSDPKFVNFIRKPRDDEKLNIPCPEGTKIEVQVRTLPDATIQTRPASLITQKVRAAGDMVQVLPLNLK